VPAGFELHPAFELELAAAEPVVVDPIDLAFDERGRAFVLELPGYPDMERPARIVALSDRDGDGRWDTRRLYAGDLGMADSILPWRRGLLVAAPPEIVYLEDTNGDGRADRRDVLLSGFAEGNPQHNVNALRYGLDNWIHGVNGGNGGRPFWPDAPGEIVDLGQDDFRVAFPGERSARRFERTGRGAGGFGMTFGPWGRSFATHNLDHLSQLIIPRRYLRRLPASWQNARLRLAPHPDGGPAELFPIGERQTRPNHPEQSSRFSAACAVTAYGGGAFDRSGLLEQGLAVFVADPSANVVHRAAVHTSGVAAEARRGRPGVEFLASTDPLFRPVNLRVGPEGALYVLDMHRGVIEHPEWIPDQMEAAQDLYEGDDLGRIYRVVPAGDPLARGADAGGLDRSRSDDLVQALGHDNQWRRLTAQRLLVEEHAAGPPAPLLESLRSRLVEPDSPLGRLHAMWTLSGLGALDRESLSVLLRDPHPELRRNAVLALEETRRAPASSSAEAPGTTGLEDALVELIGDPESAVRLQAILTAGFLLDSDASLRPEYGAAVVSAIVAALARPAADRPVASLAATRPVDFERDEPWLRLAAVSVLAADPVFALGGLLASGGSVDPGVAGLVEQVAALVPADRLGKIVGDPAVLRVLAGSDGGGAVLRPALLAGLTAAVSGAGNAGIDTSALAEPLRGMRRAGNDRVAASAWRMSSVLEADVTAEEVALLDCAGFRAADASRETGERLDALALFAHRRFWPESEDGAGVACTEASSSSVVPGATWLERVGSLLDAAHPEAVQRAAMAELSRAGEAAVTEYVVERWPYLGPAARRDAGTYLIRGRGRHGALLDAIESGRIRLGEMNFILERRRFLLRSPDPEIRRRAAKLFDDAGVVSRPEALAAMRPALGLEGDPERGETLFLDLCARCHRIDGRGGGPGPDLSGIGRKSAETLLHDILDPNAAVDTAYVNYIVETVEGDVFSGLLAASPAGGVVLRAAEDALIEIPAERILEVRSDGLSMMPEELEAGLEPADLADLLAFLGRP
jgi:putative membrane-bound dehydrogenase-like protein